MAGTEAGAGGPKRFRTKEQIKHKRDSDRARAKTRVNLGDAFQRWRELRRSHGFKTDPELALFLLNGAGAALATSSEAEHQTVTSADETMHRETPSEHQEEDVFEFPDPVTVRDEDDLTEKSACIAYEECLRKLGSFLQLPIQKCPHVDPVMKTECGCCSPFQVGISRRGTAFIMEWRCSSGHSLWTWNSQPLLRFGMQSGDLMLSSSILLSGSSYSKVGLLFKHMNMGTMEDTELHGTQDSSMKDFWQRKRAEVLARLKEKNSETTLGVQQLQVKEEQQEWNCSPDQEDTELQHFEEEWNESSETVQDRELIQGLKESGTNTLPLNIVTVKNEDDEDRPQLSKLHQRQTDPMETGESEEDCGGPEPDSSSHSESDSAPEIEVKIEDSSESETDDSEVHICCDCDEKFTSKMNLIRHRVVHIGEKPFSCSDCGKRCKHRHLLNVHSRIHTERKPFRCSDCGKLFKHEYLLARHTRIHTGERPFSCPVCHNTFKQQSHLTSHMNIHAKEKPYSCSYCEKTFNQKSVLTAHTRIHTGEKPFSCSVCLKTFRQKGHLTAHMQIHTKEKPLGCSEFSETYNEWHVSEDSKSRERETLRLQRL